MGKMQNFAIMLPPPYHQDAIYYSGQIVQGTVVIDLSEPLKMRGVHVKCIGKAQVHWKEEETEHEWNEHTQQMETKTRTKKFRDSEEYIDFSIILWGKPEGQMRGENPELPAGHWEFPFSFQLPPTCPASYESFHGNVRYKLKATIDKPWKIDHVCKRSITVLRPMDLNHMPHTRIGISQIDSKNFGCLCWKSGPLLMEVQLDRSGFVPGEFIFFNIKINNNSDKNIGSVKCKLEQRISYRGKERGLWGQGGYHTKEQNRKLVELPLPGVEPMGSRDYPNVQMRVPLVPASELQGCSIINIQYQIEVEVNPSGFLSGELDVHAPITIGTIPLADSYAYYLSKTQPEAPAQQEPPQLPEPAYNALHNEEGDDSDSDDDEKGKNFNSYGETSFAPRYHYYNYGPPM